MSYSDEITALEMAEHSLRQALDEVLTANRVVFLRQKSNGSRREPNVTQAHRDLVRHLLNLELYALGLEVRARKGWNGAPQ